jgi:hypothetical protein
LTLGPGNISFTKKVIALAVVLATVICHITEVVAVKSAATAGTATICGGMPTGKATYLSLDREAILNLREL